MADNNSIKRFLLNAYKIPTDRSRADVERILTENGEHECESKAFCGMDMLCIKQRGPSTALMMFTLSRIKFWKNSNSVIVLCVSDEVTRQTATEYEHVLNDIGWEDKKVHSVLYSQTPSDTEIKSDIVIGGYHSIIDAILGEKLDISSTESLILIGFDSFDFVTVRKLQQLLNNRSIQLFVFCISINNDLVQKFEQLTSKSRATSTSNKGNFVALNMKSEPDSVNWLDQQLSQCSKVKRRTALCTFLVCSAVIFIFVLQTYNSPNLDTPTASIIFHSVVAFATVLICWLSGCFHNCGSN